MRLRGERAAARARALVESFRPRLLDAHASAPRVVLTGFGAFPGAPRNATAEMIAEIASAHGIAMRSRSFRRRDFTTGRGALRLPTGREVHLSLMVLPVLWDGAAALVAKEARASRASLVVMSGIAKNLPSITLEGFATSARKNTKDASGMSPSRAWRGMDARAATLDVEAARLAGAAAFASEVASAPELASAVAGVAGRARDETNAYVCNATAHVTAKLASRSGRVLRSTGAPDGLLIARTYARHGFIHWPADIAPEHVAACARVLLAMVDALTSEKRAGGAR